MVDLNPPVPLRIKLATTAALVRQAAAVKPPPPPVWSRSFSRSLSRFSGLEGAPSYSQGDIVVGSIRGGTQQLVAFSRLHGDL
jgi:hypothetical protein